jgi:hypothetical protein
MEKLIPFFAGGRRHREARIMSSTNTSVPSTTMNAPAAKVAKKAAAKPATSAPAPTPAPAAPAPVVEAPKKAKKAASASPSPVASTAPAPVAPVATQPVAEPAAETPEVTFEDELKAVQESLETIRTSVTAALAALKRVSKRHAQDLKEARKNRRKVRKEADGSEPRKPNNFEIPVAVSDELSAFFGGGKNAQMSRSQVNKAMGEYIKKHSLGQGQKINPDAALKKLLGVTDAENVTIFNIQKYLKRHYPQSAKA